MRTSRERVLVVENDPDLSDLIARQTLQAVGYVVKGARSAGAALQEVKTFAPDVIVTNLSLPGLSGKDLLVALNSQEIDVPVIAIAGSGMESDMIQAFRLGASDALFLPVREAEIVAAVERVLKQVRSRRERDSLARQLQGSNTELQQWLNEINATIAVGKTLTAISDMQELFEKTVEGGAYLAEADQAWMLMREEQNQPFLLSAAYHFPEQTAKLCGQPWDDGLSSLVALSGEPVSLSGEGLAKYKIAELGKSALVVPIKIKKQVTGMLGVLCKEARPFTVVQQKLLCDTGDFAAIAIASIRKSQAVEARVRSLQQAADSARKSEKKKDILLNKIQEELQPPLLEAIDTVNTLLVGEGTRLNASQKGVLRATERKLKEVSGIIETVAPLRQRT